MAVIHTEDFRHEAVRITLSSGLSRSRMAADLGIGKSTLGYWISQYRTAELPVPELQTDLARENERLRLENRVLREEREILKKPRSSSRANRCEVRIYL
ncbi:transposase [Gluconobacter wancherniae]|uniref:transposase n=1 Tax=Gluconobacter wancherniae TaxID=1307955 RepID=UPI003094A540